MVAAAGQKRQSPSDDDNDNDDNDYHDDDDDINSKESNSLIDSKHKRQRQIIGRVRRTSSAPFLPSCLLLLSEEERRTQNHEQILLSKNKSNKEENATNTTESSICTMIDTLFQRVIRTKSQQQTTTRRRNDEMMTMDEEYLRRCEEAGVIEVTLWPIFLRQAILQFRTQSEKEEKEEEGAKHSESPAAVEDDNMDESKDEITTIKTTTEAAAGSTMNKSSHPPKTNNNKRPSLMDQSKEFSTRAICSDLADEFTTFDHETIEKPILQKAAFLLALLCNRRAASSSSSASADAGDNNTSTGPFTFFAYTASTNTPLNNKNDDDDDNDDVVPTTIVTTNHSSSQILYQSIYSPYYNDHIAMTFIPSTAFQIFVHNLLHYNKFFHNPIGDSECLRCFIHCHAFFTDVRLSHHHHHQHNNDAEIGTHSSSSFLFANALRPMTGPALWRFMPYRRREFELKKNASYRRRWNAYLQSQQQQHQQQGVHNIVEEYLPKLIDRILRILESSPHTHNNETTTMNDEIMEDENIVHEKTTNKFTSSSFTMIHHALEFLIDLLLTSRSRRFLRPYLSSIHFTVRCSLSPLFHHKYNNNDNITERRQIILFRQLHAMLVEAENMVTHDTVTRTATAISDETELILSERYARAHILQKLCHRHYPDEASDIIYAGVSMICQPKFLKRQLDSLSMNTLFDLTKRLRLVEEEEEEDTTENGITFPIVPQRHRFCYDHDDGGSLNTDREYITAILLNHHSFVGKSSRGPTTALTSLPLYPNEALLWDPHRLPPGNSHGKAMIRSSSSLSVLALPKIQTGFLTYTDYLLRCFKLVRLESAYGIRGDLVDVISRMRPSPSYNEYHNDDDTNNHRPQYHPNNNNNNNNNKTNTTIFRGWARMGLEMDEPMTLLRVDRPNLGQTIPSQVRAELVLDLKRCGESIREEWDALAEFDNLFLVCVDAARMTGEPAPSIETKYKGDIVLRTIPDEEDVTFPRRYGITAVRGCMVLEIRDEAGTLINDVMAGNTAGVAVTKGEGADDDEQTNKKRGTKRFIRVALDAAQYAADATGLGSDLGTDVYKTLNVVVRRHGRENNFKAVLETIRGLMTGSGSIDRSIPTWLQPVLLGHGNPRAASYSSQNMRAFARNTAGVTPPDAALDYGDTFLDEDHLRKSFEEKYDISFQKSPNEEETMSGDGEEEKKRKNYRIRVIDYEDESIDKLTSKGDAKNNTRNNKSKVEAISYPFHTHANGNPVRFTPVQVEAIRSGLSPGLTLIVGPPGTGKTDVAVQIIANLYHSFPTQRTVLVTHSNAALNDLFEKVMERGDVDERYLLRLGAGERDLRTSSQHDFTKTGRVQHILFRRGVLLEHVQCLSESLGVSGKAERGADGSPSYTCETAEYFYLHHVKKRIRIFERWVQEEIGSKSTEEGGKNPTTDVSAVFPFASYFETTADVSSKGKILTVLNARQRFREIHDIFVELAEYRPLELLRSQRQRTDYLLTKQAKIVAMTCTHAAIVRSHLVELGFQYDNVVMEEAGQMLDVETFIPFLIQRGESDETSTSRLKRLCLIGDHHQLPPVVKNMSFSKFSNLDQSMFSRLIRLGVPTIELNKQGRARPDIALLYSWRYRNLGNLEHVQTRRSFQIGNAGFAHTYQLINVEDFEGRGESTPSAYFYQNMGEAEYAIALFQYMVLIGYPPEKISLLTTYNGQKDLLMDILSQRCGSGTPLAGMRPGAVSTVDQYQGQQNDFVILSLVRTNAVGHLRDIRRLVVAVSRARLGLYLVCRQSLFTSCHELRRTMDQFLHRPNDLELVRGEHYPTNRKIEDVLTEEKKYVVKDVTALGSLVYSLQQAWCKPEPVEVEDGDKNGIA